LVRGEALTTTGTVLTSVSCAAEDEVESAAVPFEAVDAPAEDGVWSVPAAADAFAAVVVAGVVG
jgi:hypothetical protein